MIGTFVEAVPSLPPRRAEAAARPRAVVRLARAAPPYLYLAPGLVLLVVWTYWPLAQTFFLSFHSWNLVPSTPMTQVGTDNYERLLTTSALGSSTVRTFQVIAGLLPFTLLIPLGVGLLTRGRGTVHRGLVFAPMLVAPVAGATVWMFLLDPDAGLVNTVLGTDVNWLNGTGTALWAIVLITGWHLAGFAVLVVAAGLAGIDPEYTAAARVDGATSSQITRWITLPLLSPTLWFLVLMTVLLGAQWTFPLIDTLTQGGPAGSSTTVYYLLWEYGFRSNDAGLAAAAGVLFFAGFMLVAVPLARLADRAAVREEGP
ncbi:sugar ABC transporter permease [Actinocorallia sp. API 0066]|uniref:carbohydrate ABC transporter permease n=1 Tax=Actinocorallia sp. API 0066 TaxID=2896846 RepID=UPI001E41A42D|nr:sugar ABC transporter permease [Actinocorallia sp. API 0066]MCD0453037.1 sugar ABC transporter permease [Actinocorallia sp. API 0066]